MFYAEIIHNLENYYTSISIRKKEDNYFDMKSVN